jgi:WD40 repeat protein
VYSIGAILYELLTGRPPFLAESIQETLIKIRDMDPPAVRLLNARVPRDLETITLKCLEKEPSRRYVTAEDLADDLGRFLRDEPILARPIGLAGKTWRWCKRKPAVAALGGAVALAVILGFVAVMWQARKTRTQRDVAQGRLYAAQMKLAHAAYKSGKIGGALELLRAQKPLPGQPDFRGFEWRLLYRLCQSSQSEVLATNASGFASVDFSPDNRTVAFGTGAGVVQVFDFNGRQLVKSWRAHDGFVEDLAFCARDGNWLATVSGDDGLLKLWDVARQRAVFFTNSAKGLFARVAFSPSGRFLAAANADAQSLDLWEVRSLVAGTTPVVMLKTNLPSVWLAEFSRDERTMALCDTTLALGLRISLFDLFSGARVALPQGHIDLINCLSFSPDGKTLASAGVDERVVLWDLQKHTRLHSFEETEMIHATAVTFSFDGQALFASGFDQNIRSWNLQKPDERRLLRGHSAGVNSLAISPDGSWLASAGRDGTARIWPLHDTSFIEPRAEFSTLFSARNSIQMAHEPAPVLGVAVSLDQSKAAAISENLVLWDLASGVVSQTLAATNIFKPPNLPGALTFSPDGRWLAIGGGDKGMVAFLDAVTLERVGEPIHLHDGQVMNVAFGLNGKVLVTGGGFGTGIKVSEVPTGRVIKQFNGVEGNFPIQPIAVSRDGRLLATGSPDHEVCLRDIVSGQILGRSPKRVRFLHSLAFSPDGQMLAFADELGTIFLWNLRDKQSIRRLVGHIAPVLSLTFSRDGRTLASAGMDHMIKLWNSEIDQEVATLAGHSGWVWGVAFAEHGNALISGSRDGSVKLWRALSFEEIEAQEKFRPVAPRGNPRTN